MATITPSPSPNLVYDEIQGAYVPEFKLLSRMIAGNFLTRVLYAVCRLGLPDLCHEQPRTPGELAAIVGADGEALGRYLRVLATVGLVEEDGEGRFHLTDRGAHFRTGVTGSLHTFVILANEVLEPTADAAFESAVTGRPAFDLMHEGGIYTYLAAHPDHEALFARSMTSRATRLHAAVLDAVDWSDVGHVVDVGGNHGAFLVEILRRLPHATGVLFDQPQVVAGAGPALEGSGVAERIDVVGGDFFEHVPPGGDLYLVANVVWNWNDAEAETLLRRCREAMASAARLLVVEPVLPPGNDPHPAKNLDLGNFWLNGGKTRREEEWRALLARAGFSLSRITETDTEWGVIEARPV